MGSEVSGLPLLSLLIFIPLLAGALCLFVRPGGARWIALVASISFAFVALKFRLAFFELFTSQTGGQLIGVAAAAGLVCAALAAWRPEPAR